MRRLDILLMTPSNGLADLVSEPPGLALTGSGGSRHWPPFVGDVGGGLTPLEVDGKLRAQAAKNRPGTGAATQGGVQRKGRSGK